MLRREPVATGQPSPPLIVGDRPHPAIVPHRSAAPRARATGAAACRPPDWRVPFASACGVSSVLRPMRLGAGAHVPAGIWPIRQVVSTMSALELALRCLYRRSSPRDHHEDRRCASTARVDSDGHAVRFADLEPIAGNIRGGALKSWISELGPIRWRPIGTCALRLHAAPDDENRTDGPVQDALCGDTDYFSRRSLSGGSM